MSNASAVWPQEKARTGLGYWLTPGRFAILLGLLLFACFPGVFLGSKTFFFRDFALFGYPLAHYFRESIWQGELPLINPYNDFGIPFLAQWNTMCLYPGSLFYLILPLSWALGVFCLLHLYLGGLGMYFLAQRWTREPLAAGVAGLGYAFNGLMLHSLMWPNNIACLGLLPWVILCVERAWNEGQSRIIIASLVAALQVLTGAPEILLQTWLLLSGLLFAAWLKTPRQCLLTRTAAVGLLVIGLTAAQMFPFLQLLAHSHRGSSFADNAWPMPGTGWANLLVPIFYMFASKSGVFYQYEQQWTSSYYLGIGILALAMFAIWQVRQRQVTVLAGFFFLSLVLSLGNHGFLYPLLKKILPVLGLIRYPVKFIVLAVVVAPLLAAFALYHLRTQSASALVGTWRRLAPVFAGVAILVSFVLWFGSEHPYIEFSPDEIGGLWRNGLYRLFFLSVILGLLALLPRLKSVRQEAFWAAGVLVFLWLDVVTHAPAQNPTVRPVALEESVVQMMQHPQAGESRAMVGRFANENLCSTMLSDPYEDVVLHRSGLLANMNLLEKIPKVDGFYSLYLKEERPVRFLLYTENYAQPLADFMGVSQVSAPGKLMEWQARTNFMPFATAGQRPVFADHAATIQGLTNTLWDPRRTVFLPLAAKEQVSVLTNTQARVISGSYTFHRQEYTVEAKEPSLLVLSQAHYAPWTAYVNGIKAPIWFANAAFQAIQVPAGTAVVRVVYEDKWFWRGVALSVATLLGCALFYLKSKREAEPSHQGPA